MEAGRLRRAWHEDPEGARGAGDRLPLRSAPLGAQVDAGGVRLRVPDRDLRPGGEANPRLLRAAVPDGRSFRRACRSESRSQDIYARRACRIRRGVRRSATCRRRARRRTAAAGRVAVARIVYRPSQGGPGAAAEARARLSANRRRAYFWQTWQKNFERTPRGTGPILPAAPRR